MKRHIKKNTKCTLNTYAEIISQCCGFCVIHPDPLPLVVQNCSHPITKNQTVQEERSIKGANSMV